MASPAQLREKRLVDWPNIRIAFVEESPCPTFAELSARFATPIHTITNCAREEGWANIRAQAFERRLRESGASELILKAVQGEGEIIQQARSLLVRFLTVCEVLLQAVEGEEGKAASTRLTSLNTLSFAMANSAKFADSMGLVGMPSDLRKSRNAGESAGWGKDMLQQINVTVNGLKTEAEKAGAAVDVSAQPGSSTDPMPEIEA